MEDHYDIVIAGQGAAGFAAALYAARYQTKTIVIGETFGGETAIGGSIENYPGYLDIDGFDLMMHFRSQAEKYDVPIVDDKVTRIDNADVCYEVETESGYLYQAQAVILAVGRERRKLGLEHEEEWVGRGSLVLLGVRCAAAPRQHSRCGRGRQRSRRGRGPCSPSTPVKCT